MEGENYIINGFENPKPEFGMNGTKGQVKLDFNGYFDIYFSKFDEHITMTRPPLTFKNIIWGGLYTDIDDIVEAVNHKTGDRIELAFVPKEGDKQSYIDGKCFDSFGNL